jgi:tellurite resistance protein
MKKLHMLAFTLVVVIGSSSMGFAQDKKTNTPRVDRREQNQQKRVADGLKDGSLTSGEAAKIEGEEAKIQQDEAKAKADGVVTPDERKKLNRELDKTSREISRDRDNTPGIDRREQNQQKRVADGLKDGSLTSGEAAKIEGEEAKIQQDEAKAKADGVVTPDERKKLNRELNKTSREISRDRDNTPGIDRREQNQQKRVANGLKDGSLSSGEAAKIERDETKIRQDEAKAKADGVVTPDERKKLNRELNKTSREISRDRDNTPGVDRREQNQQNRVADGLKNGSLTAGEAAKIEKDEAKIKRDEAKAKSDGVVTSNERAKLNRELNHTSREIHRDKHNNKRQR